MGYLIVIFVWSVIKFFRAGEKSERSENVLLSISERQKSNMKTALVQTAMSWYEFNADSDCIYDSKIYLEKDHYVDQPEHTDKKYSEYFSFFLGRISEEYVGRTKKHFLWRI